MGTPLSLLRKSALWAACAFLLLLPLDAETVTVNPVAPSWRFVTGGRIRFAPAVDAEGTILCASDERMLYGVGPSGLERWRLRLPTRPVAAPMVGMDGTVYQAVSGGRILVIRPSGSLRRTIDFSGEVSQNPAMDRHGTLFVPLENGELGAVRYSGEEVWRFRFKAGIAAPPVIRTPDRILLATRDRLFHALTPEGTQAWTVTLPGVAAGAALGPEGSIYVSAVGVHALDAHGTPLWTYPTPGATTPPVVTASGNIIVGCTDGMVYVLTAQGEAVAELDLGVPLSGGLAVAGPLAVLTSGVGGMYVVDLVRGVAEKVSARDSTTAPSVVAVSGLAVMGSRDWVVYARCPPSWSYPEQEHPWDQWMGSGGHTGTGRLESSGQSGSLVILDEMARSPVRSLKAGVLEQIAASLEGREYLAVPASGIGSVLGFLAGEGVTTPIYVGKVGGPDYPRIRIESCRLLGELGTRAARRFLVQAVEHDPSIEVQCAGVRALGVMGADPDGTATRAIAASLRESWDSVPLMMSAIAALGSIARAGPLDPVGYALLVRLAREDSVEGARDWALDVLRATARWGGREGEYR